jgi:hypothetical protein
MYCFDAKYLLLPKNSLENGRNFHFITKMATTEEFYAMSM